MIIWKIRFTLHFGIISLIPCLDVPTPILLKPNADGHLPYSNFKIGKLDTPTIFKNGSNGKVHQKFISIGLAFLEELANKQTKK